MFPQKAVLSLYNMTQSSTYFDEFEELKNENIKLKNEIAELKNKMIDYDLVKSENQLLNAKDEISREFSQYSTIIAEVISFSPNNFEKIYTINKGSKDGIKEKMTVITQEGLVGYVSKVLDNTSNITAIIDASTSFSARNTNTKDLFVAGGTMSFMNDNKLLATEIPFGSSFQSGDIIETSGIGSLFPRGIKIGKILEYNADENPLESSATIQSSVDFNKLDVVAILLKEEI